VRADEDLTLVLIERWLSLFQVQVLLNIFANQQAILLNQLLDREWVLGVVDFALQHGIQVLKIDVRILDKSLRRLSHEDNFDLFVDFVNEQINDFKHEGRLARQQNFRV